MRLAAQTVVYGMNHGITGFQRWQWGFDHYWNFGSLTERDPAYWFKPYGPVFYPSAITARSIGADWKIMQSALQAPGIHACIARSPDDRSTTVLIVNPTGTEVSIDLDLSGLPGPPALLHRCVVDDQWSGIQAREAVAIEDGSSTGLRIGSLSIQALTTLPLGDLDAMRFAVRRGDAAKGE